MSETKEYQVVEPKGFKCDIEYSSSDDKHRFGFDIKYPQLRNMQSGGRLTEEFFQLNVTFFTNLINLLSETNLARKYKLAAGRVLGGIHLISNAHFQVRVQVTPPDKNLPDNGFSSRFGSRLASYLNDKLPTILEFAANIESEHSKAAVEVFVYGLVNKLFMVRGSMIYVNYYPDQGVVFSAQITDILRYPLIKVVDPVGTERTIDIDMSKFYGIDFTTHSYPGWLSK